MTQTIDVTGLSPDAVRAVQQLVDGYREAPPPPPAAAPAVPYWDGPIPTQDSPADLWIRWFNAWCDSHPRGEGPVEIDDDRGSIYDRDTP